ncbi:MAG TPA: Hsp20/alpha crystallin family protein [Thermoanaerobaculia bacterium]|nr:Hsp20/alpha crystallin family protein [Thermoanaerobaculia bacterium]
MMVTTSRFHAALDRLFEEVLKAAAGETRAGEWQPFLDVLETPEDVAILVEVPGVAREDLEVAVEGRTVTLSGTKRPARPEAAVRFHRVEREEGRFERRLDLLHPVNTHEGRAWLDGGLLVVRFPKVPEKRARRRTLPIEDPEEEA